MSKQIVFSVTRGYQLIVDDDDDLIDYDMYKQAINENGADTPKGHVSLELVESQSKCVHFETDIVEENDI